ADRPVEQHGRERAAGAAAAPAEGTGGESEPVRPPDRWRFTLPAAATTTVAFDGEMEGTLSRVEPPRAGGADTEAGAGTGGELGRVPPGRSLTLALDRGTYEVAAVCSRRNDLVRCRGAEASSELVVGGERLVQAPVKVAVASGGGGLVEIASYAASDVRARLYAADGTLVADADDRPDDWNFLISERLPAGSYRLEVEPVGRGH